MASSSRFNRLRARMAPLLRPAFERIPPLRWLALQLLALRQPREVELDGDVFQVVPRDFGVTLELHATGGYENASRRFCLDHLQPGMTFVDIGAHVGLFSVPAARRVGASGRVIAFEPDPDNRRMLEENISRNRIEAVQVHSEALCDRDGRLPFHRSAFNTGDHQLFHSGRGRTGCEVDVARLDTVMARLGGPVHLIKMDVQGAEAKVLAGMRDVLDANPTIALVVELSPWMLRDIGDDPLAMLQSLEQQGFELATIDESTAEIEPGDAASILDRCAEASYLNVRCLRGTGS